MSGRNWIFTINNPATPDDDPVTWEGSVRHLTYCVWQKESGENGTPHYQVRCRSSRMHKFRSF